MQPFESSGFILKVGIGFSKHFSWHWGRSKDSLLLEVVKLEARLQ